MVVDCYNLPIVSFFVPGPVVGKMRARHARRGARVVTYSPQKQVGYERHVRECASAVYDGPPLDQPLKVNILIYVNAPVRWPYTKKIEAFRANIIPTGKPDLDNCVKSIFDALNGLVWRDDSVICHLQASKAYGQKPGAHVTVSKL